MRQYYTKHQQDRHLQRLHQEDLIFLKKELYSRNLISDQH